MHYVRTYITNKRVFQKIVVLNFRGFYVSKYHEPAYVLATSSPNGVFLLYSQTYSEISKHDEAVCRGPF